VYLLPQLIEGYRKKYPKVRIEVTRQNSMQLIHDIREHIVDLSLISFAPDEKDVETLPVMNDELILVTSPDHPLTKKRKVNFADLATEAFIAHTVASPSRHKVIEAFRASNTPLNIVMEVAMIETIKKLIAMNLGIGFIPRICVQDEIRRGELACVPFEGFQYQRTLWLARRRTDSHSHAANAFWNTAFSK